MRSTALPARLVHVCLALACCGCGSAPSSPSSTTSSTTPSTTTPTTPTFACAETTSDPLEIALRKCHDLNGDGVIDSRIDTANNLLRFTGAVNRDITLNGFASNARIASVTSIGQYVGGALSEVVVRVNDQIGDSFFSVVYVVDPESGNEVARWTQPFRTPTWVWTGFALTTGKLRIPIIAPGQEQANVTWNYVCKYTPGTTGGSCGDNFTAIDSTPPNASSFRHHQGVWLQDADDDGTEDLNMSFYTVITGTTARRTDGGVLTLSPRTGARSWLTLNMAENGRDFEELFGTTSRPTYASLKGQAQGFESGRLYGAASGFRRDGRDRALMVGSDPVGYAPLPTADYNDAWRVMCNVSRYVAMISHPIGQPNGW